MYGSSMCTLIFQEHRPQAHSIARSQVLGRFALVLLYSFVLPSLELTRGLTIYVTP